MIVIAPGGPEEYRLEVSVWRSILRLLRTYGDEIRMVCEKEDRMDLAMMESEVICNTTEAEVIVDVASVVIGIPNRWMGQASGVGRRGVVIVPDSRASVAGLYMDCARVLLYRMGDVQMCSGILIGLRTLIAGSNGRPR